MARSTRLVIKIIYTLWGRKRFLLPVTSDESSIPFCSTSNGYTNTNKEERYSRVRLSDTRYSKGNGDMQAAKRD